MLVEWLFLLILLYTLAFYAKLLVFRLKSMAHDSDGHTVNNFATSKVYLCSGLRTSKPRPFLLPHTPVHLKMSILFIKKYGNNEFFVSRNQENNLEHQKSDFRLATKSADQQRLKKNWNRVIFSLILNHRQKKKFKCW